MESDDPVDARGSSDVRVWLPRGQLRYGRHLGWSACRGARRRTTALDGGRRQGGRSCALCRNSHLQATEFERYLKSGSGGAFAGRHCERRELCVSTSSSSETADNGLKVGEKGAGGGASIKG